MTVLDIVSKVLLPLGLIVVMFGMGLTLKTDDFKRVLQFPQAGLTGILGQLMLLPLLGFVLISLFSLPDEIMLGIIILSACPGGIISNVIVYSGKADTALSITLTAINSFVTVFTIPLIVKFGLVWVYGQGEAPDLPIIKTIGLLFSLAVFPIILGMVTGSRFTGFAQRSEPIFRRAGTYLIIFFILFAVWGEWDFVLENLVQVAPMVLLFNLITMFAGFILAKAARLELLQRITVTVEIGLQNNTLAFLIALTILNNRQYMIFSGFYGIIMMVTAGIFVTYMRKTRIERNQ